MSLEAWSTAASIGTFVVIATTAGAALAQLRHMQRSNQIAVIMKLHETLNSETFVRAGHFVANEVPKLVVSPAGRSKLGESPFPPDLEAVRAVGNYFDLMGALVRLRTVDEDLIVGMYDGAVVRAWKQLEPVTLIRRAVSFRGTWCDFEYLAMLSEKSISQTGGDRYPRGAPRMMIDRQSSEVLAAFLQDRPNDKVTTPTS